MKPIRTQKGKLVGMLDVTTDVLHIKDRTNTRMIEIPLSGLTMQFIDGSGKPETIRILPQSRRAAAV